MEHKRINSYDFLKVVGTICIVCTHYQQFTKTVFEHGLNFYYVDSFPFGVIVEMFFILSGLFAAKELLENRTNNHRVSFNEYISKKAIRLLPMTGITAIAYETAIYFFSHYTTREWPALGVKLSFWGTITNIIGMQKGWGFKDYCVNTVTWYISVLLICYIILFFLYWLAEKCNIPLVYLFMSMIILGTGIISYSINLPFFNRYSGRGYYSFFVGVMMGAPSGSPPKCNGLRFLAFFSIVIVLVFIVFKYPLIKDGIGFTMTFIFFPALIWLMGSPCIENFFQNKILEKLALVSFDVYVWQLVGILILLTVHDVNRLNFPIESRTTMIGYVIILYLWGFLSNHFITQPVTKRLRHLFGM